MPIRPAVAGDLVAINDIYNHYVLTSTCTYQTEPSTMAEREAWFVRGPTHPVYVMEEAGVIVAWHSLTPFKTREAYARTVENSIYVADAHLGRGLGRTMLEHQISVARDLKHHAILAVICASQEPSLKLHESFGFEKAAHFKEVGHKFGRWLDVVVMQKLI